MVIYVEPTININFIDISFNDKGVMTVEQVETVDMRTFIEPKNLIYLKDTKNIAIKVIN